MSIFCRKRLEEEIKKEKERQEKEEQEKDEGEFSNDFYSELRMYALQDHFNQAKFDLESCKKPVEDDDYLSAKTDKEICELQEKYFRRRLESIKAVILSHYKVFQQEVKGLTYKHTPED